MVDFVMAFSWDSKNVRGVYVEGVEVVNYTHLRGLKFCTQGHYFFWVVFVFYTYRKMDKIF